MNNFYDILSGFNSYRVWMLLVFSFLFANVNAQNNDALLWTSIEVEKEFKSKITLKTELGYRLYNNYQNIDKYYGELGIGFKFNKYFKLYGRYRFIQKEKIFDDYFASRHRVTLGTKTGFKYKKFRFNWTCKYQLKVFDDIEHNYGNTKLSSYNRNKFQVKYKASNIKLFPYISYEFFIPLHTMSEYQYTIDTQRFSIGAEYQINKQNSFKLFYMLENELQDFGYLHNNIVGLSYAYSL